ncbi:protein of unknown function with Ser1 repeat [Magnetospira sp. QH-2]|nr:protein of unknown function with Ser1 repeat [Magnetospira sp. QH-2]
MPVGPEQMEFDCRLFESEKALIETKANTKTRLFLGLGYATGQCGSNDPLKGIRLLHEVSRNGDNPSVPTAMLFLGLAYDQGWGVGKDREEARYWFQRLSLRFVLYETGKLRRLFTFSRFAHGLVKIPPVLNMEVEQAERLRQGSTSDLMAAYKGLWTGEGYPLDHGAAKRILLVALKRQSPEALYEYARRQLRRELNDVGSPRAEVVSAAEAMLAKAALLGFGAAQRDLGLLCAKSPHRRHWIDAAALLYRAQRQGQTGLASLRELLSGKLAPEEIALAQARAETQEPIFLCEAD